MVPPAPSPGSELILQPARYEGSRGSTAFLALTAIAAAFFTLYRVVRIAVVAWRATAEAVGRTRKVQGGFVAKALGRSETGTDFVFLVLLFMTVAVLYMNNASELGSGLWRCTVIAAGLLRTLDSIATPCSVNA